ncbi:uncharacterized protein LOC133735362 [Rosa rugosa]|uniref:uncharacterized protein LOC133735362 n=1 Tax=Rosa rugosa TaxID=74645 RepID=UPI002B416732|nr:uncharacterized protein LOC133735362 [Rosa rugosa]
MMRDPFIPTTFFVLPPLALCEFDQNYNQIALFHRSFLNQEQVNGIIIPRFRMLCAMERNIRSQSQFRYRANSIMVDHEGLAEYKKKKKENDIPRTQSIGGPIRAFRKVEAYIKEYVRWCAYKKKSQGCTYKRISSSGTTLNGSPLYPR